MLWTTKYQICSNKILTSVLYFLGNLHIKWWNKWWSKGEIKFRKIDFCQRFQCKPQKYWRYQWISLWFRKCAGWYHSSRCKAEQYWSHRLHLNYFIQIGFWLFSNKYFASYQDLDINVIVANYLHQRAYSQFASQSWGKTFFERPSRKKWFCQFLGKIYQGLWKSRFGCEIELKT